MRRGKTRTLGRKNRTGPVTHELKLRSGRLVLLRELRQRMTYEGLLEGLPTAEMNQGKIRRLLGEQSNHRYNVQPLLIPPVERPIERPDGDKYPFGTPSALPPVTSVARFESLTPTIIGRGDTSGLVVIWFQEEFAYPPPRNILEQLEAVDWDRHAGSFDVYAA